MDDLRTRATLLLDLRDVDNAVAWNEFVEVYTPLIYRFCRSRGVSTDHIADVTQDTLQSVVKAIQTFEYRPEKGKFRSWLFRVTYSRLARHMAKENRQPHTPGASVVQNLAEAQGADQLEEKWNLEYRQQMFRWATSKVRPSVADKAWEAFWLTAVDGKSGQEVGALLGMSTGAVYVAKSRIVAQLRQCVASVAGEADLPKFADSLN